MTCNNVFSSVWRWLSTSLAKISHLARIQGNRRNVFFLSCIHSLSVSTSNLSDSHCQKATPKASKTIKETVTVTAIAGQQQQQQSEQ